MMKRALLMVSLLLFPRLLVAENLDIQSLVGEDWYGIYMNGQKAGFSMNAITVEKDSNITVVEDATFRVKMNGIQQNMRMYLKRTYTPGGELLRIDQRVDDVGGSKLFEAQINGNSMTMETTIGGNRTSKVFPKPKESLKDAIKQVELIRRNPKVGDQLAYTIFDPIYGQEMTGTSTVDAIEQRVLDGVSTKVYKVKSTMKPLGLESVTYVTEHGKTLEDQTASTIITRLEPKEIAKDVTYSNDVIVSNAVVLEKPIDNPRGRDSLQLVIEGPLGKDHLLQEERQQFEPEGDRYRFASKKIVLEGFKAAHIPVSDGDAKKWIEPSLLVQSNDPRLIAKAKEIVGDETDTFAIATKLCHWTAKNVRTTYSARLTNSLEVLEHPEGDCTEHSMLFIGLARAAGVPAREAAGLIYVNEEKPGFYFHQWASVWVGKWIDVDPTFDQPLADVTHIKLAMGDLIEQSRLIPVIGQLKIKVVE